VLGINSVVGNSTARIKDFEAVFQKVIVRRQKFMFDLKETTGSGWTGASNIPPKAGIF
jgi:hypothetical protein